MSEFEQAAARVEQVVIDAQRAANGGVSFAEHQAGSWSEIRQFFDDSKLFSDVLETPNGPGSTIALTEAVRGYLPGLFMRYDISTVLDAPCGDANWAALVDWTDIAYTGWDCEPELVKRARNRAAEHGQDNMEFERINLLTVPRIPCVDVILSRDFLAHLPNEPISLVLQKFKNSGSRYLLTSHYPGADNEFDYQPEAWTWFGYAERCVNFEKPPFDLGPKVEAIAEQEGPAGNISEPHELALFRLND